MEDRKGIANTMSICHHYQEPSLKSLKLTLQFIKKKSQLEHLGVHVKFAYIVLEIFLFLALSS